MTLSIGNYSCQALAPLMSYNLNSLEGVIWGIIYGTAIGVIKGDTRSLDYSSYE